MGANGLSTYPDSREGAPIDLNTLPETEEVKTEFNPLAELQKSWIDPAKEVKEPPVILEVEGVPTLTAGNISTVIGKAKSKKTFFMMGLLSAVTSGNWGTMNGVNRGKTCLWFDTEQSLFHASKMVQRCYKLGGVNIQAYTLRGYTPAQRVQLIEYAVYNTDDLEFVAIDGQRDLLSRGINDEEEATSITGKFLKWTTDLDIHIMVVLHTNKDNNNARGHIGTELMNKSECVISVTKSETDNSISVVTPDFTRNREFEPFAFTIDDTGLPVFADMPMKHEAKQSKNPTQISNEKHFEILGSVFKKQPQYKYAEMWSAVQFEWGESGLDLGELTAKRFLKYYIGKNWIDKDDKRQYKYTRAIF